MGCFGSLLYRWSAALPVNCTGVPWGTGSPAGSTVKVTVPSAAFTPTQAGTYRWRAFYSGDANNAAVSGGCGDTGENDTVIKASPTIATR